MSDPRKKPAVIVISSHVARGSVGNRAAVFALEALGFPVWVVPTIQLPWHPGHGPATSIVAPSKIFSDFLEDLGKAPWINEVGAVLSGYMANPDQVKSVATLIGHLKHNNPSLTYLCDPVIGDVGGLYVAEETAAAIQSLLIPISDIATPNRFELSWLTQGQSYETLNECLVTAQTLGDCEVLITSTPSFRQHETGNLFASAKDCIFAGHRQLNNPPNGPGDLTAALFLGHRLAGMSDPENLGLTTASVFEILEHSANQHSDELTLEDNWQSIISPSQAIDVIHLPDAGREQV